MNTSKTIDTHLQKKTRTGLINLISSIQHIKERYIAISKDVLSVSKQAKFEQTLAHYDQLLAEATKELHARPIGYRYTGVYYLKKPYMIPPVFEKHSGSLYMQENLVSWQIQNESGVLQYPYYRAVYKEPNGAIITRDDAEPVYPSKK